MPNFTKHSILDFWQCSEYASDLLKLLCHISKRNTCESWYMPNWIYYSLQTEIFPLFLTHTWKDNIHANERLTKVKKMIIKFDVFVLSFIFFIPMSQIISVIKSKGACNFWLASNQWHPIPHIKWRRLSLL